MKKISPTFRGAIFIAELFWVEFRKSNVETIGWINKNSKYCIQSSNMHLSQTSLILHQWLKNLNFV